MNVVHWISKLLIKFESYDLSELKLFAPVELKLNMIKVSQLQVSITNKNKMKKRAVQYLNSRVLVHCKNDIFVANPIIAENSSTTLHYYNEYCISCTKSSKVSTKKIKYVN